MSETLHAWNFQNVQSVGGGFLTHEDKLRFFVGARSGDCTGASTCTDKLNGTWDGNGTTGTATMRRDRPSQFGLPGTVPGGQEIFTILNPHAKHVLGPSDNLGARIASAGRDGFASVTPGAAGIPGVLSTAPLEFSGAHPPSRFGLP